MPPFSQKSTFPSCSNSSPAENIFCDEEFTYGALNFANSRSEEECIADYNDDMEFIITHAAGNSAGVVDEKFFGS